MAGRADCCHRRLGRLASSRAVTSPPSSSLEGIDSFAKKRAVPVSSLHADVLRHENGHVVFGLGFAPHGLLAPRGGCLSHCGTGPGPSPRTLNPERNAGAGVDDPKLKAPLHWGRVRRLPYL